MAGMERARLPDGKLLIPGVVSHATNLVEHPQVVADVSCATPMFSAAKT